MNYDLRNSELDWSQRILNAMEPETELPIHRHMKSSETVVCLGGHIREIFHDESSKVTDVLTMLSVKINAEQKYLLVNKIERGTTNKVLCIISEFV